MREAAQSFLIPLWNAVSFFTIYANLDDWSPGAEAIPFAAGSGVESIERAWRLVRTRIQSFGSDWLISGDFERMR